MFSIVQKKKASKLLISFNDISISLISKLVKNNEKTENNKLLFPTLGCHNLK